MSFIAQPKGFKANSFLLFEGIFEHNSTFWTIYNTQRGFGWQEAEWDLHTSMPLTLSRCKQAKKNLSPSATGALFPPQKTEDDSHQDMMASEMN